MNSQFVNSQLLVIRTFYPNPFEFIWQQKENPPRMTGEGLYETIKKNQNNETNLLFSSKNRKEVEPTN